MATPEQSSFERSWGQLAALYPHDSLPEVAENTVFYGAFNVSYTCMLHLQYALDDLSQYIGASRDCSLIHVLLLFVAALRVLGEPPPPPPPANMFKFGNAAPNIAKK